MSGIESKLPVIEHRTAATKLRNTRLVWRGVAEEGLFRAGTADAPGYPPAEFAVTRDGILHLRGACMGTASPAFILPKECWTTKAEWAPACTYNYVSFPGQWIPGYAIIYDDGAVFVLTGAATITVLDHCRVVL